MISTPIGGFSGDSSLGLGGTWCRARSIAAEDFDAGVDVAMGSAHQDCGPVGFSTVQNCAGSCIYCCMYPRVGARLVPEVLVAVLGDELLLPSVSSELGLPRSLRIGQLDEQAAALGDPYTRIVLGREVARCARVRWRRIVGLEVMVSFGGRSAPELELSTRACKHLLRINPAGRGTPESEPLRNMTVSELALIPGFGPECLLEVLSVAKRAPRVPRVSPSSPSSPPPSPVRALARKTPSPLCAPSRELLLAARALARAPWSASVSWEDPRLGGLVREINRDARSPRDAAERTLDDVGTGTGSSATCSARSAPSPAQWTACRISPWTWSSRGSWMQCSIRLDLGLWCSRALGLVVGRRSRWKRPGGWSA